MTPRLTSSHHSCQELTSFPGITLEMINTVGHSTCFLLWLKTVGHPLCTRFAPVQSFHHEGMNISNAQSDLGGYGFHWNSAVLSNESINQLDDVCTTPQNVHHRLMTPILPWNICAAPWTLQGTCSVHRTLVTFFDECLFPYSFHCQKMNNISLLFFRHLHFPVSLLTTQMAMSLLVI